MRLVICLFAVGTMIITLCQCKMMKTVTNKMSNMVLKKLPEKHQETVQNIIKHVPVVNEYIGQTNVKSKSKTKAKDKGKEGSSGILSSLKKSIKKKKTKDKSKKSKANKNNKPNKSESSSSEE
ncbi:hypothetical protein T11_15822 [Trichinella zimbabwensis]|uniref:Uncharacterized protein n=1 Tax=Trichinella zimbabwensis TaxID=268475 RepID=A0A0V1H306_9BILA|nr:hypothetical protein T11_15822 [Trichinella zimbabwensis]